MELENCSGPFMKLLNVKMRQSAAVLCAFLFSATALTDTINGPSSFQSTKILSRHRRGYGGMGMGMGMGETPNPDAEPVEPFTGSVFPILDDSLNMLIYASFMSFLMFTMMGMVNMNGMEFPRLRFPRDVEMDDWIQGIGDDQQECLQWIRCNGNKLNAQIDKLGITSETFTRLLSKLNAMDSSECEAHQTPCSHRTIQRVITRLIQITSKR